MAKKNRKRRRRRGRGGGQAAPAQAAAQVRQEGFEAIPGLRRLAGGQGAAASVDDVVDWVGDAAIRRLPREELRQRLGALVRTLVPANERAKAERLIVGKTEKQLKALADDIADLARRSRVSRRQAGLLMTTALEGAGIPTTGLGERASVSVSDDAASALKRLASAESGQLGRAASGLTDDIARGVTKPGLLRRAARFATRSRVGVPLVLGTAAAAGASQLFGGDEEEDPETAQLRQLEDLVAQEEAATTSPSATRLLSTLEAGAINPNFLEEIVNNPQLAVQLQSELESRARKPVTEELRLRIPGGVLP